MKRHVFIWLLLCVPLIAHSQLNTDRITAIGRNALYFDDYVLSIQYFNQVIKVKPYLAEPYLFRAIAKIQLGDYTGAERDCTAAIERSPFMPGAYYTRGFVYFQLKKYEQAANDFSEALIFAPENKTYMLLRADTYAQMENYDVALQDIEHLLQRDPTTAQLHFEKGTILLASKDTLGAQACFAKSCELDSQNPSNWSALGLTNILINNDNDALLALTKAINLGSKWPGDYINRGIIFYRKHNFRGALADYDKAIELTPENDDRIADVLYNRGILRAELGDYNNALDDLNKALSYHETPEANYLYQHGMICMQLRLWNQAYRDFFTLIETYPYFLPSYYLAAQAKTALGDTKEAYRLQSKASNLEKDKENIQKQRKLNTDVQIAESQPQRRDRKREFSNRAAQNLAESNEESKFNSATRGPVQKRYADVVNEPNFVLSYYAQSMSLRRTNYSYYLLQEFNQAKHLPSPLHFVNQELALTADMVNQHFTRIEDFSNQIDLISEPIDSIHVGYLFFSRAVELALVQDYSSAIEDCTQALQYLNSSPIIFFTRANLRYKLLDYQRSVGELSENSQFDFELILRDYDQVIRLQSDFAFAYYNKANILCSQKAYQDAIDYYSNAIKADHDFAEAWFNRGLTKIFIDDVEDGISDLSKAGELGIYQAYNIISRFQ